MPHPTLAIRELLLIVRPSLIMLLLRDASPYTCGTRNEKPALDASRYSLQLTPLTIVKSPATTNAKRFRWSQWF